MMERKDRMTELRNKGLSYQSIGALFGITRQRVHQILSGYHKLNHSDQHKNGWYRKIKNIVIERDGEQCQICHSKDNLIVHHIDKNCENNNLSNLITLCNHCHLNIHRPNKPKGG